MKTGRLLVLAAFVASIFTGAAAADRNLLLITIDTLRPDRLGCYGSDAVQTPRIDSLAARGVLFDRAFAHNPMTLPSHANILVGMTALAHGVSENSKSVVPEGFETLAEVLKRENFETGAFVGAFPLDSRFGLDQGFDVYDDFYPAKAAPGEAYSERRAEKVVSAALAWLSERKGRWFCWVHLWDPHAPYTPPEPYAGLYREDPYSGEVAYVDGEVGRLLDGIEKSGGLGETLVVLTGDHGESLGEHGEKTHSYFAYNSTIWVPLIVAGPGTKRARTGANVCHVDVFPTVCELLGVKPPRSLHGGSLVPLMKGRTRKAAPIYFESLEAHLNRGWAPLRGIIDGEKKYIDSPIPELYDLAKDFGEGTNLAPETETAAFKKALDEKMKRDASETEAGSSGTADRETRERLRSLGYVASPVSQAKRSYGPEDDLKTLFPLEEKLQAALEHERKGEVAESVRLLEEVIRDRGDFVAAYDQLARLYDLQGRVEDGLRVLENGYRENSDNPVMVSIYGVSLVENGRMEEGIDVLGRAVGLFGEDAEAWNSLGVAYWHMGDFDKALAHFEQALALDPNDAIYNDNMGSFFVTTALRMKDPKDLQRALGFFEKAIAADPALASAYNGYGGALKILGRTDEAIANWEKAVELDPGLDFPVYNLALAYLEKDDKVRALEYCEKYLEIKGTRITPQEKRDIESLVEKCKR
jgi:arylsulfatase A-like enzyme/Flp pilus assembly protein TadD